jgi:hypothetical protein
VPTVPVEVAVQPSASVVCTVTAVLLLTTIDCVMAPVDHNHDAAALAVRVTLPPVQNVVGPLGEIVAVGVETLTLVLLLTVGQLATKTETVSVIGSVLEASNVIVSPVVEPTIVPLVIAHAYVAPGTTGVDATWFVEFAQTLAGAVMTGVDGQPTTETATVLVLFALFASGVVLVTVAVLVSVVPLAGAVTLIVMTGAVPVAARLPRVHTIVVAPLQLHPVAVMLLSATPAGSVSVTV